MYSIQGAGRFAQVPGVLTYAVTGCSDCMSCVPSAVTAFITLLALIHRLLSMPVFFRTVRLSFYSASALLAMQSSVLARGIPSVCPSVTLRYCVQRNEDTIVQFSASGRTIPSVSGEVKFIRIFAGEYLQRGR